VRCSSRDPDSASWLQMLTAEANERVSLHKVVLTPAGPEDPNMLDDLCAGCAAVFFAAGFEKQEPATIDFMVNNSQGIIAAASRNSVGVVVLTSSGGSTNAPGLTNETPKEEHKHWSDHEAQLKAQKFSPAAKTLMDLKALEAVGRDKANEIVDEALAAASPRLCILNPNLILGPQLQPGAVSGNSLPWVAKILKGEAMAERIPNDSMSIIDVRDLAALHVAAAEIPSASGRYFGVDQSHPWENIFAALKKAHPAFRVPPRFEGPGATPTQFNHSRKESLGVAMRPLEETMADLIAFMKERDVL